MKLLKVLVTQRINEAALRGKFNGVPGIGTPSCVADDLLVTREVRAANLILRNAGFMQPDLEQLQALRNLQVELDGISSSAASVKLQARTLTVDMALESLRNGGSNPIDYCRRVAARLSKRAARVV